MLAPVLETNPFYQQKLGEAGVTQPEDIRTLEDYRRLPFTKRRNSPRMERLTHPTAQISHFLANGISASIKPLARPVNRCAAWIRKRVGIGGRVVGRRYITPPV